MMAGLFIFFVTLVVFIIPGIFMGLDIHNYKVEWRDDEDIDQPTEG